MKLIDILARDLKEWPTEEWQACGQASSGDLHQEPFSGGHMNLGLPTAEDYRGAVVTRAQWQEAQGEISEVGKRYEVLLKPCEWLPHSLLEWKTGDEIECIAMCKIQGAIQPVFFNRRLFAFSTLRKDCYRPIRNSRDKGVDALCDFITGVAGGNDFHRLFWERAYDKGLRAPE